MIKRLGIILLASSAAGVAHADEEKSMTLFTLGVASIQYSEDTGAGITASGKNMTNLTQRSSGYTPVGDEFGFYITTVSTLSASQVNESWNKSPYGIVQQNQRKVSLSDLVIDAAWDIYDGIELISGLSLNRMNFSRSGFTYPQGTRGTLATTNPATGFTPDKNGPYQQLTAAGGYIRYMGRQLGAIFEDSTSLMGEIGLQYDTIAHPDSPWRFMGSAKAGIPLYYYVTNSNYPNTSWTSSFKGYNLHADIGLGYQIKDNFDIVFVSSGDYRYRPQTSTDSTTGGSVPNNTTTIIRMTAGLSWSY